MLIVHKFGGTSVADKERLMNAARICGKAVEEGHSLAVTVSAMGDTTDRLTELALEINPGASARELDALLSCGETQSAALLAMAIKAIGIPAVSFAGWQAGIITDDRHGNAEITIVLPVRLRKAIKDGFVPVVAGFQGLTPAGDIATLGRGGSDTTAVALAAALNADECRIYTDVAGIYTADPNKIPTAQLLREIDRRDMLVLAKGGSQVLHSRSVDLAIKRNVTLRLLSSFEDGAGTAVLDIPPERRRAFAGVTCNKAASSITLAGRAADGHCLSAAVSLLEGRGIAVSRGAVIDGGIEFTVAPEMLSDAMAIIHGEFCL